LSDTRPDVITSRKYPFRGFSGLVGLFVKLVDGYDVCYHDIDATGKHQEEGDDADGPYKIKTEEEN
jgi:hypothetical protein